MKYPIDQQTVDTFIGHIAGHDRAQRNLIQALTIALKEAISEADEESEWVDAAKKLIVLQEKLRVEHETRRFNESNGHVEHSVVSLAGFHDPGQIPALVMPHTPGRPMTPEENARLNDAEAGFGEEMSEEDLARLFNEKVKKKKEPDFKKMSLEQIEEWEAAQNNSNDIYKIKARVANLARGSGASLTAQGEMLCNTFVHVLKSLYEFAEKIEDKELKIKLIEKIRSHENAPATLIAAAGAGVKG